MYDFDTVRVDIAVVLNPQGEVVDLRILEKSLFPVYDQEAIRTLGEAAPFPNPPRSLIQDDNLIYLVWSFTLNMNQWASVKVE